MRVSFIGLVAAPDAPRLRLPARCPSSPAAAPDPDPAADPPPSPPLATVCE